MMTLNAIKVAVMASAVLLASGCTTSKFSCPGMPDGVMCKRPSEVYGMTHEADRISPDAGSTTSASANCGKKCSERKKAARQAGEASALLTGRLLEPLSGPMPIREAPQVMRIWVAPYNDENDDLHWPSYVFSEITKRRWTIGEMAAAETVVLTPMQVDSRAAEEEEAAKTAAASQPAPKSKPGVMTSQPVDANGVPVMPKRP